MCLKSYLHFEPLNSKHFYNTTLDSSEVRQAQASVIFKGNTVNSKTTNLIVSARFLNINYVEKPTIDYDPIDFYSNEKFIMSGIGITTRNFIQDKYIFKNGVVEDVPIGRIYGLTMGYQYKNNNWRPYLGGQVSFGSYHNWGFLSTNFEIGTFFNKSKCSTICRRSINSDCYRSFIFCRSKKND